MRLKEFVLLLSVFISLLLSPCIAWSATEQIRLTNDLSVIANSVSGPGKDQSPLTDGGVYTNTLGLNAAVDGGSRTFNFNFGGLATDDPRVDPEQTTITNLQANMTNGRSSLNLGDTMGAFSQYTLSSSLKGLSYTYNFSDQSDNSPQLTFIYGYAYPRWDNFNSAERTKAIKRKAYGVRFNRSYSPYFTAGVNYMMSRDSEPVNPTDMLYDTNAAGIDWEYKPLPNVSLRGESTFGETDSYLAGSDGTTRKGSAHRVVFDGTADPTRLTVEYERIAPGFVTVLGSATTDREKAKFRWRYKQSKNKTLNIGLLWFRNNLGNDEDYTTHHYKPEISMTMRKLFNRQYASGDVSLKLDRSYGGGKSTTNSYVNFGYQDRFGIFDSNTNLGITLYDTRGTTDTNEFQVNQSLSTRYTAGDFIHRPSINLGIWTSRDELAANTDRIYEMSLGWNMDYPKANLTSSIRLGQNKLLKDADGVDDNRKFFGTLYINYRPAFVASVQGAFYLRATYNDYNYTTGTKNFRESSLTTGFNRLF